MGVARARRWDRSLFWGFMICLALVRAGHTDERDPYWQVRAGMENLAGVPLVRPDTWSWSGVGGDWYPNSPLWNLLLAGCYQWAGVWGVFALSAVTILLLVLLVASIAQRLGARPLPGLIGALVVFSAAFPMLNARATLAVQVLLLVAVQVVLVLSDRATGVRTGPLVWIVLAAAFGLSVLGNWVHLSFLVLAPGLAVVWAVVWLLTPGLAGRHRWALALAGGAGWMLGWLMTPYGVATGLDRSRAVQAACAGLILEWSSPFAAVVPRQFVLILGAAVVIAALSAWWLYRRWRSGGDLRELAALSMIGVPAAVAGLFMLRFLGIALLVLAPVVVAAATRAVDLLRDRARTAPWKATVRAKLHELTSGGYWRVVLTSVLIVLSPGVVFLAAQHGAPAEGAVVDRLTAGCHLFSGPGTGGTVALFRPDVPVWIDGRSDFFGRTVIERTYDYFAGRTIDVVPAGTTCVILEPDAVGAAIRGRLSASPQWRLETTGSGFELWLPTAGSG